MPAPRVVGIAEPPVVPEFCRALSQDLGLKVCACSSHEGTEPQPGSYLRYLRRRVQVLRVDAYVTAPTPPEAVQQQIQALRDGGIDVVALTSGAG